jgi:CheY-like chemotaxis protein
MSLPHVHTILVVEDEENLREMTTELLISDGYAFVEVGDGQEALDYMRSNAPPCLILLDLAMPRMNGLEFLRHKAQDPGLHPENSSEMR